MTYDERPQELRIIEKHHKIWLSIIKERNDLNKRYPRTADVTAQIMQRYVRLDQYEKMASAAMYRMIAKLQN